VRVIDVERPTPLAFPLMVDMTRAKLSTEKLADRVRRMTVAAEKPTRSGVASVFRIGATVEKLMQASPLPVPSEPRRRSTRRGRT
jgi:ATP-dependent Lhr-like helicase